MGRSRHPYIFRLFEKAFQMTRDDCGFISPKAAALNAILAAVTLLVIYHQSGIAPVVDELSNWWVTIIAVISWFGLVFFWNLIISPLSLQKEADLDIDRLEKIIFDGTTRQDALNELWKLRSVGIEIRNENITGNDFSGWITRYESWREKTLETAKKIDINFYQWLYFLDTTVENPGVGVDSEDEKIIIDHDKHIRIISTILDRIIRYLIKEFRFEEKI